jgi:peptidoglycan/LPS O-acetylase OafA/YrhL
MRAIAVLAVVAIHVGGLSGANVDAWYGAFTSRGNVGVTLFFLISSFLLYRPYVVEHLGGDPAPPLAVYGKRRVLRILPAYWLALTALAIWPGLDGVFSEDWWAHYGLLTSYWIKWMWQGIPVSWSLSVEVAFYVTLPVLAAGLGRLGRGGSTRRAVAIQLGVLAALGLCALVFRAFAWLYGTHALSWTLPSFFLWFALGMMLAVVSAWLDGREKEFAPVRFVGRHADAVCAITLLVFVSVSLLPIFPRGMTQRYSLVTYELEYLFYAFVAFGLLLPVVFGESEGGVVRRVLAWPVLDWLGRISYGVFLWHHTVLREVGARLPLDALPVPLFVSMFIVTLGITVALAWASYRFVEQPFMRLRGTR